MLRRSAVVLAAVFLAGCQSSQPLMFQRADGQIASQSQFDVDKAVCLGRMQQTNVMAPSLSSAPTYRPYGAAASVGQSLSELGDAAGDLAASIGRRQALDQVYVGCMAERGWMVAAN